MNRLTKLLFLVTSILVGQDNSLTLTSISRPNANQPFGTSGNTARSIEIYISEDVEDLSLYGCATSNTINSAESSGGVLRFPAVSVNAGDFIYITKNSLNFEFLHGFAPTVQLNGLNFNGGTSDGYYCVIELIYSSSWDSDDIPLSPQVIDYWASNSPETIINGGWAKRSNCFGPNSGPDPWSAYSNVFNFDSGTLLYENFNILEWTYSSYNSDPILFGTYTNNCPGCTDANAVNFNQNASFDDNSCEYAGCTNPFSFNFDLQATYDDGSCIEIIAGCFDSGACNYNPDANTEGLCTYPEEFYDCLNNCLNDFNDDGICDEIQALLDSTCSSVANIFTTNECGQWQLLVNIDTPNNQNIENLEINIFENGSLTILTDVSDSSNQNEYIYIVESANTYEIDISSINCNFNFQNILIPTTNEVYVPEENFLVINPTCSDGTGEVTGIISGPPGLYSVYIDGSFSSEISVGINDLEFENFVSGNSTVPDCEGNSIFLNDNSTVALSGFNNLQDGDWIGAFYNNPNCGYSIIGNLEFNSDNINQLGYLQMAIFGDDPTSDYVDGPQDGEDIIWLIESQGQVYEAEVNWNTSQGFSDCNSYPGANGLCQGEISTGPFFINEFSQDNLSIGEHTIEILDGGNCQVFPNESFSDNTFTIEDTYPGIENVGVQIENNLCALDQNGSIELINLSDNSEYNITLFPSSGLINQNSVINLPNDSYTLILNDLTCEVFDVFQFDINSTNDDDNDGICNDDEITGCTDETAFNFDPNATDDDGLCIAIEFGCTDAAACNYDIEANVDDGSCLLPPFEPTSLACYENATFNIDSCSWEVTGEQDMQPEIACYETSIFDPFSCNWIVTGVQEEQPATACYETATFNTDFCSWEITGEQELQPATTCYETATFNTDSCSWEVTGEQELQPVTTCYETATFNTDFCSWEVTVEQEPQPVTACYETATFNNDSCSWEVTGEQELQPATTCYETATFNNDSCSWEVTGEQEEQPLIACYETATFNNDSCSWEVTGEQDLQPATTCYEIATFNFDSCSWVVSGQQEEQPLIACYETATFNSDSCSWEVTGEQEEQPLIACYETATFNSDSCSWEVTGDQELQPVIACYETAIFDTDSCTWLITGFQETEPTDYECYEIPTFDDNTCTWLITGLQDSEPDVACYETTIFNNFTCEWEIEGVQDAAPSTECYETVIFSNFTCEWEIEGVQDAAPSTECYETAIFDTLSCSWEVIGQQDTQPDLQCDEIATFDSDLCEWVISGDASSCLGCVDTTAFNFDSTATLDDGSCIEVVEGCIDETAFNFDSSANTDDGTCEEIVFACIDSIACNFDEFGNVDDGSCFLVESVCDICIDGIVVNQDLDNDLVCDFDEIAGCTNPNAYNYNPEATDEDNSCLFSNCPVFDSYSIENQTQNNGFAVSCSGETDALVNLNWSGGGTYQILLEFVSTNGSIEGPVVIENSVSGNSYTFDLANFLNQFPEFYSSNGNSISGDYKFTIQQDEPEICTTESGPVTIEEPPLLELVDFILSPDCFQFPDDPDGNLIFTLTGGVPNQSPIFDYEITLLSDFAPEFFISNQNIPTEVSELQPNTEYTIQIEDGNGCLIDTVFVTEQNQILIDAIFDNTNCPGEEPSAFYEFQISGGTPPYQYSWFDPFDPLSAGNILTTDNGTILFENLPSAEYVMFNIQDVTGCESSIFLSDFISSPYTITVSDSEPISINATVSNPIICYGDVLAYNFTDNSSGVNTYQVEVLNESDSLINEITYSPQVSTLEFTPDLCCPSTGTFNGPTNASVALVGASTLLSNSDVIGAFFINNDGEYVCAGSGTIADGFLAVWETDDTGEGFSAGETINYFVEVQPGNSQYSTGTYFLNIVWDELFGSGESYIQNNTSVASELIVGDAYTADSGIELNFNSIDFVNSTNLDFTVNFISSEGCTLSFAIDDNIPSEPISVAFEQTQELFCADSNNAQFIANTTGGIGDYTYEVYQFDPILFPNQNSVYSGLLPVFDNLSHNDSNPYYVLITDGAGCEITESFTVPTPQPISVTTTSTNTSCNSLNESFDFDFDEISILYSYDNSSLVSDGSILVDVSGGQAPHSVTDISGQQYTTELISSSGSSYSYLISNLSEGTYFIQVADDNDCLSTIVVENIEEPEEIVFDFNVTNPLCVGDTAYIELLELSGGTPFESNPYLFVLPTGVDPNGANTNLLISNSYNQTGYFCEILVDSNGCQSLLEFYLEEPEPISTPNDLQSYVSNPTCFENNDGQIGIVDINGGSGNYSFEWIPDPLWIENTPFDDLNNFICDNNDACLENLQGLGLSFTHTLLVTDENDCTEDFEFTISGPEQLSYIPNQNNSEMVESWPTEIVLDDENNLQLYSDYGVSCNGANNGFVDLTISGGTGEYTYQWSNGETTEDIFGLSSGEYTVDLFDENNCVISQTYIITEPDVFEIDVMVSEYINSEEVLNLSLLNDNNNYGVSCYGEDDGYIFFTISGGTEPYYYSLNGSQINNVNDIENTTVQDSNGNLMPGYAIININAGIYDLFIYDSNFNEFIIEANQSQFSDYYNETDFVNCNIENLGIELNQPNEILIDFSVSDYNGFGVSCFGENDGLIQISLNGGEGNGLLPYDYTWTYLTDPDNPPATLTVSDVTSNGNIFENLLPYGIYSLEVSDLRGCKKSIDIEVSSPENLDFSFFPDDCDFDISCYGETDGFIKVDTDNFPESAGNGYSYEWMFNGDFFSDQPEIIEGLSEGYYSVTITDNITGCSVSYPQSDDNVNTWFISEPPAVELNSLFISDINLDGENNDYNGYGVSCFGSSDGIIEISVFGGSGNFEATLTNLETGDDLVSLESLQDFCENDFSLIIDNDIDDDGLTNDIDNNIDGDDLDNENDPLIYFFGDGSVSFNFSDLSSGNYSLTITDLDSESINCPEILINNIEITEPPNPLYINNLAEINASCFGVNDGAFSLDFGGGLPNAWNWGLYYDESAQDLVYIDAEPLVGVNIIEPSSVIIDNLFAGVYYFVLYDINGFFVSDPQFADLGLAAPSSVQSGYSGCSLIQEIIIDEPAQIAIENLSVIHPCGTYENIDSSGNIFIEDPQGGAVSFSVSGGNPPYNITLETTFNNLITDTLLIYETIVENANEVVDFNNLFNGIYQITIFDQPIIVDADPCTFNDEIPLGYDALTQIGGDLSNAPLPFSIVNTDNNNDGVYDVVEMPECEFSYDGSVNIEIDGGSGNFDILWSNGETDNYIDGLSVGTYSVEVFDQGTNCFVNFNYIMENELNCQEVPSAFSPNGDGINDTWVIGAIDEYVDAEVIVYNRWGERVFYSPENKEYWDGKYKGSDMPIADYFYIINNNEGEQLSHGRLTLKR